MAISRNEMLLRVHRDAGFSLLEMQGLLLLFTDRTRAHSRFVGSFPQIPQALESDTPVWPLRAIWAVCDFEMGRILIDYEKVDIDRPNVMDKVDHGNFVPEVEQLLPNTKGRLQANMNGR